MKLKYLALLLTGFLSASVSLSPIVAGGAESSDGTPQKETPARAVADMMEAVKAKDYEKAMRQMRIEKGEEEMVEQLLRMASEKQYFNYRIIETRDETASSATVQVALKIGGRKGHQSLPVKRIDDEWKVLISRDRLLGAAEHDFRWEDPAVPRERRALAVDTAEGRVLAVTKKPHENWPLKHPDTRERTLYKAYVCFNEECSTIFPAVPGVALQACPVCGSRMTGAAQMKHKDLEVFIPEGLGGK